MTHIKKKKPTATSTCHNWVSSNGQSQAELTFNHLGNNGNGIRDGWANHTGQKSQFRVILA